LETRNLVYKCFSIFFTLDHAFLKSKSLNLSYLIIIIRLVLTSRYYIFSGLVAIKTAVKLTIKTADHEPALNPTVICQLPV
jgi:hypothetical protein